MNFNIFTQHFPQTLCIAPTLKSLDLGHINLLLINSKFQTLPYLVRSNINVILGVGVEIEHKWFCLLQIALYTVLFNYLDLNKSIGGSFPALDPDCSSITGAPGRDYPRITAMV